MPTARVKPINIFAEIDYSKIERRDDGVMIVPGYAFVNEVVRGEGEIRLKRAAMEAATPEYMKFGAVREMHQPIAAGTAILARWDDTGAYLEAEIVDAAAKEKVERKVYKGFSVSVRPTLMRGKEVEACEWIETSLVDRPKDPDALFLHRADDFDPEQEVECEVVGDDPGAAGGTPSSDDVTAAPVPEDAPAAPAAASEGASERASEGASEGTESEVVAPAEHRAPSTEHQLSEGQERVARALIDTGIPEDRARTLAAATEVVEAPPAGFVGVTADPSFTGNAGAVEPTERAISTETPNLPVRENLEPNLIERYIKQKGDKWCVYSEDGKLLGEHDTKAEAVDQLAAIEANKAKRGSERASLASEGASEEEGETLQRDAEPVAASESESLARSLAHSLARSDRLETSLTEAITRAEVAETFVAEARTTIERLETSLASAVARAEALAKMPRDRMPPVRYPSALSREALVNLGAEGEATIARLRQEYADAEAEAQAERDGDRAKRDRALETMIERAAQLAQHGVYLKP